MFSHTFISYLFTILQKPHCWLNDDSTSEGSITSLKSKKQVSDFPVPAGMSAH